MTTIKKSLANGEQLRTFIDGSSRSCARLRAAAIGLGTYQPGWKWSVHAGAQTGRPSEHHVGYLISGRMMIVDASGIRTEVGPGDAFEVLPGHDAWVLGAEPCVALDFSPLPVHSESK